MSLNHINMNELEANFKTLKVNNVIVQAGSSEMKQYNPSFVMSGVNAGNITAVYKLDSKFLKVYFQYTATTINAQQFFSFTIGIPSGLTINPLPYSYINTSAQSTVIGDSYFHIRQYSIIGNTIQCSLTTTLAPNVGASVLGQGEFIIEIN